MEIQEALAIVLELAEQNVIDKRDMPEEHKIQMQAIRVARSYAENIKK